MAADERGSPPEEWRRSWPILVPSVTGVMLVSIYGYSLGVMIGPLEDEFGWSRAAISGGALTVAFVALIVAPLTGAAADRVGPRRIALIGIVLHGLALAFLATTPADVTGWWLRWGILGVTVMFIVPTIWTSAINRRFERHRGKALALALCGTGLAGMFVPAVANLLIAGQGWRMTYVWLSAGATLVVWPLTYFLFDAPLRRGARDAAAAAAPAIPPTGTSARAGLTSARFLKLNAAVIPFSIASCALTTNGVPVLIGLGFARQSAAEIAGVIGLGSIIGRLAGGALLDRFDAKKVAAVSVLAPVLTVALFLAYGATAGPALFACFILGLSAGTEYDACAYLTARHFGMRSYGTLFGTMTGLLLLGNGLAPLVANHVYDVTKSYALVLYVVVPMCVASSVLFLWLGPYPDFDEPAEEPVLPQALAGEPA